MKGNCIIDIIIVKTFSNIHSYFMKYLFKIKEIKTTKPDMCKLNLAAFDANRVRPAGKAIRAYGPTFGTVLIFLQSIVSFD